MRWVRCDEEPRIEENLFSFALGNPVPLVLPGIALVPVEPDNTSEIDHGCILLSYT